MTQTGAKWIRQIVELQQSDGSWGHFHTLSAPSKEQPMTTEQALRRLRILGLTKNDEPVARALAYLEQNLQQAQPTVFHEKKHDSKTFGDLMLAAWIRLFDSDNEAALFTARKWTSVISCAFKSGAYCCREYAAAYEAEFGRLNPKAGRLNDFVSFYQLALLPGLLSPQTESAMLDYVLAHPDGIYYVYESALNVLPAPFASRKASRYISAMELLAVYPTAPQKLGFIVDWLHGLQDENGQWDMGPAAKDGIYFPLSDSWRKAEDRTRDCTLRITALLQKLELATK